MQIGLESSVQSFNERSRPVQVEKSQKIKEKYIVLSSNRRSIHQSFADYFDLRTIAWQHNFFVDLPKRKTVQLGK